MKFSYAKIEDYCSQMKALNTDMKKQFDSIKDNIKSVNSNWTGKASDNYIQKVSKVSTDFNEFTRELDNAINYLIKCSDKYEKLEKDIQAEINESLGNSNFFNI